MAIQGDIKVAMLYFNVIGDDVANKPKICTQNNYIQINGMVLSQDLIKQLAPDELMQTEEIIKSRSNCY
jgi:hypothetical protein